jgi:hypothetical protein
MLPSSTDNDGPSAHRTNRRPGPPLHPATMAEINQVLDGATHDRD